jgi:PBP1b-binding outer membrane lipoprotein LpoB
MKEQTAVDFLIKELSEKFDIDGDAKKINKTVEQAKEMEKQRIKLSYKDGRSDQQSPKHSIWFNRKSEEYYNDMFKSEE